ncbi:MAG: cobalamin-dependent protein [Planctomycetota bacterium]
MRVILVSAPYLSLYGSSRQAVGHYFPLGLGYLAAVLEKHNFPVELVVESAGVDVFHVLRQKLGQDRCLFVGISPMSSSYPQAVKLAGLVREMAPGTPTVLGGPHAIAARASILREQPEFDFRCLGEREWTTLELARQLAGESTIPKGLCAFRQKLTDKWGVPGTTGNYRNCAIIHSTPWNVWRSPPQKGTFQGSSIT